MAFPLAAVELRKLNETENSWIKIYRASLKRTSFEKLQHLSVLLQNGLNTPHIFTFQHYSAYLFSTPKTLITEYTENIDRFPQSKNRLDGHISEILFSDVYPERDVMHWIVWEASDIKTHILRRFPHLENMPDLL